MKYTFVNENNESQTVNIPDDFIKRNRAALGINTKEAILMYLSDEGYITDPVVNELCIKAKTEGGSIDTGAIPKKRKAPSRKEDPIKRAIIGAVYQYMLSGQLDDSLMFGRTVDNLEVMNPERVISFSIGKDRFELTLSKKRAPKD